MDTRVKRLLKDILIFTAGNASSKVILLLLMPLYTTKLTTAEYGISDTLNTLAELLIPIVTLCMAEAIFRFSIDTQKGNKEAVFVNGGKVLLSGYLVAIIGGAIVKALFDYQYTWACVWLLITFSIKQVLGCYLRGIGKAVAFAISGVVGTLSLAISNVLLLICFDKGLEGYLLSILISNVISGGIMLVLARPIKLVREYLKADRAQRNSVLPAMLRYSIPTVPNSISWWLNSTASKYILLFICGTSVTGLFSAAGKIPAIINLLSAIFQLAWQFESAKEYDKEGMGGFYSKIFSFYSPFILLACSFVIVINPLVSNFLLQGEFLAAQYYVPVLLFSATLNCYSVFYDGIYTAAKQTKMLMVSTVVGAIVNMALCLALIPVMNVYGALIANVVSYAVVVAIRLVDSRKIVQIKYNWKILTLSLILVLLQSIVGLREISVATIAVSAGLFVLVTAVNLLELFRTKKPHEKF